MMRMRWNELGSPTTPGTHYIRSLEGEVTVKEQDIIDAQNMGGNPWVDVLESTTFGAELPQYVLGLFSRE